MASMAGSTILLQAPSSSAGAASLKNSFPPIPRWTHAQDWNRGMCWTWNKALTHTPGKGCFVLSPKTRALQLKEYDQHSTYHPGTDTHRCGKTLSPAVGDRTPGYRQRPAS